MASFDIAYRIIERWEGGYQAFKEDTGNYNSLGQLVGTNWGISAPVYESFLGKPPSRADMQNMSKATAKAIYKKQFWDDIKGDSIINQSIANILFDGRVNHGHTGVKLMQRILGVVQDGVVGPITLNAINTAIPEKLHNAYKATREAFYKTLANRNPSYQKFIQGWLNRIRSFEFSNTQKVISFGGIALAVGIYYLTKYKT